MPEITNTRGETHTYEPGCYVDGHWGQYGASRVLAIADDVLGTTYRANALRLADMGHEGYAIGTYSGGELEGSEQMSDEADRAETALNDATPEGFIWHWHDGEFFLSPLCTDETDCTDETCAHWC